MHQRSPKSAIFLGGFFPHGCLKFVESHSIGIIQYAADALQRNLITGLRCHLGDRLSVINLPFVGSYPLRFRRAVFPAGLGMHEAQSPPAFAPAFVNVSGLKFVSRFFGALCAIRQAARDPQGSVLFVYSAHQPFILAALLARSQNSALKICLIVPDLPEFMGGAGLLHSVLKLVERKLFYSLAPRFDFFIVLTDAMISRLNIPRDRSIVMEGIASDPLNRQTAAVRSPTSVRSFLYTGTLARRYGITTLLDAFALIRDTNVELWICGDGDGSDLVKSAAIKDRRIRYFGQVSRDTALNLQLQSTILINPRSGAGEFTRYSFPSKIMEYMATGRPVIMYKLEGIPSDYDDYYISPVNSSTQSLAMCMTQSLEMSDSALAEFGARARTFVLTRKSAVEQTRGIVTLVDLG